MGQEVTIGGERLGSGKKMKAYMHGYERSTHNLSYIWRSSMAAGTIVPFLTKVALPNDTWDIHLNCEGLTLPTNGPLFGSYKIQLDVFLTPMRLYNGQLHMNALGIGMHMNKIKLPQIILEAEAPDMAEPIDNQQINASALFSYLNIRGLGTNDAEPLENVFREFNAIPYLIYFDTYKNYYANKQEEIGVMIHKSVNVTKPTIQTADYLTIIGADTLALNVEPPAVYGTVIVGDPNDQLSISIGMTIDPNFDSGTGIILTIQDTSTSIITRVQLADIFENISTNYDTGFIMCNGLNPEFWLRQFEIGLVETVDIEPPAGDAPPQIRTFPLENIDTMRKQILTHSLSDTPFMIDTSSIIPYNLPLEKSEETNIFSKQFAQEGLLLKTYNSDLFNNWISTEWIDGVDGISAITTVSTEEGGFTIDALNLSQKVYNMLNRIALSGGTYYDYLDAVYDQVPKRVAENPMYMGGLIKELVFQEVISNAATGTEPLGTLAGRGRLSSKHKGGNIVIKVEEPSYITGYVSITPRIDYSQGNEWDVNLRSIDDLHKPALDEIGFQDLITDQMAWFDTRVDNSIQPIPKFKSAGKQPAWINYMTSVNQVRGTFAEQNSQMFMVLNRRYEATYDLDNTTSILDLTTYIDPSKFNFIFADTRLDAQNFWMQIGVNIEARRKMSAKIIPNL